jgi:UDP-N-acetylglucosamine 2-epimerase (non-hydrolysing)
MSRVAMVLGIRPDIIRASIFINKMKNQLGTDFVLIWSGQHYSDNLKDIFFKQLAVCSPDIDLGITGQTDAELVGDLLPKLGKTLEDIDPNAVIFLGDTNTVAGSMAAAQLNIPIVHIEGCMRSYDWAMPEEKYRKVTDHLSDLIFAYLPEYKAQGLAEGIPNENIEVCGNPIVDVLETYYLSGKLRLTDESFKSLLMDKYALKPLIPYALMTSHRRENVENQESLRRILHLAEKTNMPVIFPAGYRTQRSMQKFNLSLPENVIQVDPIGYLEILELLTKAEYVLTDSGTLVEEACILGTPSIQMRHSTERPQVYSWGSSVKFDPSKDSNPLSVIEKVQAIQKSSWDHGFGDGFSSDRMFESIINKLENNQLSRHDSKLYLPWSAESLKGEDH